MGRRGRLIQREQFLLGIKLLPAQTTQELANGHLADSDLSSDLTVGVAFRFEAVNQPGPRMAEAVAPFGIAAATAQRSQTAVLKSLLESADGADRITESPGDIVLISPPLLDEADHGISLRHGVTHGILCQDNPGNHHDAETISRFDRAPLVEDEGVIRVPNLGE